MQKRWCTCCKFQTYKAHLITSRYAPSYWDIKKERPKVSLKYLENMICLKQNIIMNYQNIVKKLI